jgi:hypothetical protein
MKVMKVMKVIQVMKAGVVVRTTNSTPATRLLKVMRKRVRVALEHARTSIFLPVASGQ